MLRASLLTRRNFTVRQRLIQGMLCHKRLLTTNFDPLVRDFVAEMYTKQPAFAVSPESIRILSEPSQFYKLLLDMIRRAESRIFISSLYIGSAETELISVLSQVLSQKPALHLYLTLDLNRSTRPGPSSTAKILLPLLRKFPGRVHVSLFRSPSLRGVLAKLVPPRFNEGWGTWHVKIYGVDNEVIFSGANLNESYFTNRQDRYLHFSQQNELSSYCFEFLRLVSKFSYQLTPTISQTTDNPHSYSNGDYTVRWLDSDTHPHYIHEKAEQALSTFQNSFITTNFVTPNSNPSSKDAVIFPIIQAGQFGIREEESTFQLLFRHLKSACLSSRPLLDLTSGYFSLYKPYQELILNSKNIDCRIVAASPKANGFYGSKGISGRIPEGYTQYEKKFMAAAKKADRVWENSACSSGGVRLSEWHKTGWTYHAKGIWLSPNSTSPPILTLFGSTNLNSRSAHIDTELSFLMVTPSECPPAAGAYESPLNPEKPLGLRACLAEEINKIRSNVVEWAGGTRKVRWTTKVLVWLVRGML